MFGPVLTVLRYRDDHDAVAIANNSRYGLSGAVWGGDVDRAVGVARRIRTGQIAVNGCGPGDAPFGGFKLSGFGREGGGIGGLHQYMELKAIGVPGMTGPLAGLHVVEIANEISGPYATKLFVDLGAEVTKIEPPSGDPLRRWGPFPGGVCDPRRSGLFEYLNAGKRGATLDLAQPDDVAAARELIAGRTCSSRISRPERWRDGASASTDLQRLNPKLVLLRISALRSDGTAVVTGRPRP